MAPLSQRPFLRYFAGTLGTIALAFGINAMVQPEQALTFFNLEYPDHAPSKPIIDALMMVYAVRDVFMGFSIAMSAYYGQLKVLGWCLVACGIVAAADGWICYSGGFGGEWNHWAYSPVGVGAGLVVMGVFD